jgi:hypothetical protein
MEHTMKVTNKDAFEFAVTQMWGFVPSSNPEHIEKFVKAVLVIVGGDGEISGTEWKHVTNLARLAHISDEAIEQWHSFDFKSARLEDLVTGQPAGAPLRMLYTAIQVASADGYHEREKATAAKAAALMGVPTSVLAAIEGLVALDKQLREVRKQVLSGA